MPPTYRQRIMFVCYHITRYCDDGPPNSSYFYLNLESGRRLVPKAIRTDYKSTPGGGISCSLMAALGTGISHTMQSVTNALFITTVASISTLLHKGIAEHSEDIFILGQTEAQYSRNIYA